MKIKKYLNLNSFVDVIKSDFSKIPDHRRNPSIPLEDALTAGFAIFHLKYPSLLKFEEAAFGSNAHNIRRVYSIKNVPSDTRMREVLDPVDPDELRGAFRSIFNLLFSGKVFDRFKFIQDYHLISIDGSGIFNSKSVSCKNCIVKNHRNGETSYSHYLQTAALVHPDQKTVFPFAPEGTYKTKANKNDCEINAHRRLLAKIKNDHPRMKAIVLADSLHTTEKTIDLLEVLDYRYILNVKKSSHEWLFRYVEGHSRYLPETAGTLETSFEIGDKVKKTVRRKYRWVNNVAHIKDEDKQKKVNFFELEETTSWISKKYGPKEKTSKFSWVTDFEVNQLNIEKLARAGRCRWKIENETFNTLKNQGYELEHNFGHGDDNLCNVFAALMMLAFLVDQSMETCCDYYQYLRKEHGPRYDLFNHIRSAFKLVAVDNWNQILRLLTGELTVTISNTS